ncbi:MAG: ferritin-like domain-containing protein [Bacteroidota bacterium]
MKSKKTSAKSNGSVSRFSQPNTLHHLFEETLKDIYNAEQQLVEALPEVAEAADNEELKDAINEHLEQTKKQAERIEKLFTRLGIEKESVTCEAMQGLIEEGKEVIRNYEPGPVRDAALIIAAQKVEHYEIATYGSLCELADVLGMTKTCEILGRSLDEEEEADLLLTEIAQEVNDEACELSEEEVGTY